MLACSKCFSPTVLYLGYVIIWLPLIVPAKLLIKQHLISIICTLDVFVVMINISLVSSPIINPFLLVLESRIHQLQSDVVLDVRRAKGQFVQTSPSERWAISAKSPKSIPREKADIPKSGQTVSKGASKSKPSRWMQKLSDEKQNKLRRQQHLQQKIEKDAKEGPSEKSKGSKSSSMLPGTPHKKISTAGKKTVPPKGKARRQTLTDEIHASVSSIPTSSAVLAVAGTAAVPLKASKPKQKQPKPRPHTEEAAADAQSPAQELAEVEALEKRLNERGRQWASSVDQERPPLVEGNGNDTGDLHLSIHAYLEACVFAGAVDRAHRFLLSQHRVRSRRKRLNTDIYNILMRVWAKKVS